MMSFKEEYKWLRYGRFPSEFEKGFWGKLSIFLEFQSRKLSQKRRVELLTEIHKVNLTRLFEKRCGYYFKDAVKLVHDAGYANKDVKRYDVLSDVEADFRSMGQSAMENILTKFLTVNDFENVVVG